ncbi:AlkA N-terminal domain-containing protein [Acidovorax sp. SUPP3334]|uniref:DNA-3-methyladenine glycosylase 2 family protein n=1 Tax=Acidovorax sp. SUPP3334 TaxID=2920881 RepID=UPI0023DE2263|nr:AlkA N-terminal domain-containing protein [Acidovorax sp. SUPP3334]GKT25160.1 DNA-3-methyladenine glycosylase 2 family protein [Acidovorax sp. SUPP3334]
MSTPRPPLASDPDDARYRAMAARDARFDGRFFTGVTSTGIYCRPVCAVRTPRRENCRFFALAAQAESAGFRPCLRCRPELAPRSLAWSLQDAPDILVREALRLLEGEGAWAAADGMADGTGDGVAGSPLQRLAARLGVSDRHLRRIFETALGVSPLQYLQTRRLLAAKQLLTDTDLPVTQVALASGFGSVRRFNAAFAGHYGLNPTQLRKTGAGAAAGGASSTVRLAYRPPLDVAALLAFFAKRQIHAVESVATEGEQALRRTVRLVAGGQMYAGWLSARFDPVRPHVLLQTSDNLHPVLPLVIARVRALLDLDADPQAINAVLHGAFPEGDGLRVPGAFDGFELAVRAVLGQQITVAAARTLAQRLMERFGEPIETPWPALTRLFPSPAVLAGAAGDALGQLGIVRQRQAAIVALAQAVDSGRLALHGAADVATTTAALCELPGIGDWTAQYIAMRALRWPDAFPAGDVALHKALGVQGERRAAQAAAEASQAWRPWRSYAVIRAWTLGGAAASAAPAVPLAGANQSLSNA